MWERVRPICGNESQKLVLVVVVVQFNLLIHQTCWHTIMLNNETCNEYKQNTGSSVHIMSIICVTCVCDI